MMTRPSRFATTLTEVVVVLAIVAVLFGLTLPAVQRVRDVSYRANCSDRLRQVGAALHGYHAVRDQFPAGVRSRGSSQPYMTWIAQLLPYLEQDALWRLTTDAYRQDRWPFH